MRNYFMGLRMGNRLDNTGLTLQNPIMHCANGECFCSCFTRYAVIYLLIKESFVLVLAMFTLCNKRHRYSVFHVSCKDGRGLSDGYHSRFLLSIQWLMTNPHSPVECHACLGTYRRNTATRSLRTQNPITLNFSVPRR